MREFENQAKVLIHVVFKLCDEVLRQKEEINLLSISMTSWETIPLWRMGYRFGAELTLLSQTIKSMCC